MNSSVGKFKTTVNMMRDTRIICILTYTAISSLPVYDNNLFGNKLDLIMREKTVTERFEES